MDTLQRLRQMLDARGWTEYRLSKESGLSISTVQNIMSRGAHPTLPTLEAICHSYGITLAQFFTEYDTIELSPDLKEVVENWLILSPEQKQLIMGTMKQFNHLKEQS